MNKYMVVLVSMTMFLTACGENKLADVNRSVDTEKSVKTGAVEEITNPEKEEDTKEDHPQETEEVSVSAAVVEEQKSMNGINPRFAADTEIVDKYTNYMFWGIPWGAKYYDVIDVLREINFTISPSPEADNTYAAIGIAKGEFPGILPEGLETKAALIFINGRLTNIEFNSIPDANEMMFKSIIEELTKTYGEPISANNCDDIISSVNTGNETVLSCYWSKSAEFDSMGIKKSPGISLSLSDYGEYSTNRYSLVLQAGLFGEEYADIHNLSPGIDQNKIKGNNNLSDINIEKYEMYKEYLPKEQIKDVPQELDSTNSFTEHDIELFRDEWLYGLYYDPDIEGLSATDVNCNVYKITQDWWYVAEIEMSNGDLRFYLINAYTGDWIDDTGLKTNLDPQIYKN